MQILEVVKPDEVMHQIKLETLDNSDAPLFKEPITPSEVKKKKRRKVEKKSKKSKGRKRRLK